MNRRPWTGDSVHGYTIEKVVVNQQCLENYINSLGCEPFWFHYPVLTNYCLNQFLKALTIRVRIHLKFFVTCPKMWSNMVHDTGEFAPCPVDNICGHLFQWLMTNPCIMKNGFLQFIISLIFHAVLKSFMG